MNKTVTINISGIVFHIEEDAYEKLSHYLNAISKMFSEAEGRDEIMADIEARIAEVFQQKITKFNNVIVMSDIDEMIALLGKPEDFLGEATSEQQQSKTRETYSYSNSKKRRRIFRDPDDKILGGVCGGIGAYFDFDPIWLRAIFAISFFVFGSGALLYILLWIIIPQAKTTAEKLEMRGEDVNIDNIRKTIQEEMDAFKEKMHEFKDDIKSAGERIKTDNFRSSAENVFSRIIHFFIELFTTLFRVCGRVIAIFIIVLGVIVVVALLSSLFGNPALIHIHSHGNTINYSIQDFTGFLGIHSWMAHVGLILVVGIPFLMLVYLGIRVLLHIKKGNQLARVIAVVLWVSGIGMLSYVAIKTGDRFSEKEQTSQQIPIKQSHNHILYLKVNPAKRIADEHSDATFKFGKWSIINISGNKINIGSVRMNIIPADADSFQLEVIRKARGHNRKEAAYYAQRINYGILQHDSILEFDPDFVLSKTNSWHAQEVKLVLKVPLNHEIYLGRHMDHIIYDIDNVTDTWDHDMVDRRWIMTDDGLACVDCEGIKQNQSN